MAYLPFLVLSVRHNFTNSRLYLSVPERILENRQAGWGMISPCTSLRESSCLTQYHSKPPVTTKCWYCLWMCVHSPASGLLLARCTQGCNSPPTHYISSLLTEKLVLLRISVQVCLLCKYLPPTCTLFCIALEQLDLPFSLSLLLVTWFRKSYSSYRWDLTSHWRYINRHFLPFYELLGICLVNKPTNI